MEDRAFVMISFIDHESDHEAVSIFCVFHGLCNVSADIDEIHCPKAIKKTFWIIRLFLE